VLPYFTHLFYFDAFALAISLLKQEQTSDASLKTKRLRCGWDNDYLAKVLAANNVEDA
jgi:hypothetical protein